MAAVLAIGCSPAPAREPTDVPCGEASTCPNDPSPTQFDLDACHADVGGPCGAFQQAYVDCYSDHRVCAYDGTTDVLATEQACAAESRAIAACGDGGRADGPD
jgi:hypothetical protein